MKKNLFMLGVLSALSATVHAQSNVTIYGVADVGISRTDTSTTSPVWSMDSGIHSGSRLGFRGTEDLGSGLSAQFAIENGYNLDTGTAAQGGRLFGRQAWVGLKGQAGAVRLGRQYTPIFQVLDAIDPFGTGFAGNIANIFNAYGTRMDNTISYLAPELGGFNGQISYGFGEVAGDNSASSQLGASVGYTAGPINVQAAYHDLNNATDTGDANTVLLAGTYDFRVVKAHAAYAANRDDSAAATGDSRSRDLMVGVSVPIGAGTILASWVRHDQRRGTAGGVDRDQLAVGYLHTLSKRTNLYTSYGRQNLKPAGSSDVSVLNFGIRHRF